MANLPPKLVVVATDFSPASVPALQNAKFYASLGAKVLLVHVLDVAPFTRSRGPTKLLEQAADEVEESTRSDLENTKNEHLADCDVEVSVVRHDSPGEALAEAAEKSEADMIIVGSHGRTGFRRVLLGSVAERVVRLATCPVLVVRSK